MRVSHNTALHSILEKPLQQDTKASEVLKRPEINYQSLQALTDLNLPLVSDSIAKQVEIQNKYQGYIDRQIWDVARMQKYESTALPQSMDYAHVSGLSAEVVQKLNQVQPLTLGHARRISGITPAALSLLLVHLKKKSLMTDAHVQSS